MALYKAFSNLGLYVMFDHVNHQENIYAHDLVSRLISFLPSTAITVNSGSDRST